MAGASSNIECPLCGFNDAQDNYESRGEDRGTTQFCDICGWYFYEPDDEDEQPDYPSKEFIPNNKIILLARELVSMLDDILNINKDWYSNIIESGKIKHILESKGLKGIISITFEF